MTRAADQSEINDHRHDLAKHEPRPSDQTPQMRLRGKTQNRWVVRCFLCGKEMLRTDTPDKTPPYRCQGCFAAVAANEADGELA